MDTLFEIADYTVKQDKGTQGLALFDWATIQETKQEAVAIPLPTPQLWNSFTRTLYATTKGEKGAFCTDCKQYATHPKQLKAVKQGWGTCEVCGWRNCERDQQAGTIQSTEYGKSAARTFTEWIGGVNKEVIAETDYTADTYTAWSTLHRAWLSGKSPSDAADDILYKHGFRSDCDPCDSDEDCIIGG